MEKKDKKLFISQKKNDTSHPSQYFNNVQIQRQSVQKQSCSMKIYRF